MAKRIYIGVEEKLEVLDYIESSGAQYIDTGIVPSDTFKIEMQIARTDLSATDGICGSYTGSQWGLYFYIAATSGKYACAYGNQNLFIVDNSNYLDINKHSVILNLKSSGLETTVDGSLISRNVFSSISNGMNFYLFKCNDGGTSRVAKIKLYSFKIYDNDILVRDYIPVKREDGTCCLYDKVSKALFTNKGTGEFISGTNTGEIIVNSKAREVKKIYIGKNKKLDVLEYIESTGTQYIDTGIIPKSTTRVVIDFAHTSIETTQCMGWGSSGSAEAFEWGVYPADGFKAWVSGNYTTSLTNVSADTNRHTFDLKKGSQKFDGIEFATDNTLSDTAVDGQTMYLFAFNGEWGKGTPLSPCYVRIYSCKIYDGETLIRDYIPVRREDGVCCLYDSIENKYYYNQGTGDFLSGTNTGQIIELGSKARKVIKGYIGINGIARQFFSSQKGVSYYGPGTPLSQARSVISAISFNDYAIFAGGAKGFWGTETSYSLVETYNKNLTKNNITNLSSNRRSMMSGKNENYAIFAGGYSTSASTKVATVDAYDKTLTRTTATSLGTARYSGAAATINNNIIIAGGSNYSTHQYVAEAYDSNLTRKSMTNLSAQSSVLGANSNSKYAIFGGGTAGSNRNNVDAYNSSLVKTTATALSVARGNPVAVTMNDLVLFVGGGAGSYGENDPSKVIDAYDSNLVRTTPATLSEGKVFFAGDTCNDYAVFAGNRSTTSGINVDVFDSNLVRTTTNNLSVERGWLAAASTGNYIIFAGGQTGELLDTVDVYEVN